MAEPLVAPELVTPPLGLVALLGRPELHPALGPDWEAYRVSREEAADLCDEAAARSNHELHHQETKVAGQALS